MSLRQLGPVALAGTDWGVPRVTWTSQPTASGMRGGSISGVLTWAQAQQLSELVDNPDRATTIGGAVGVLEHLVFDDELLRPFAGWWLLESFDLAGEQQWSLAGVDGPVPFTLSGVFLGADREAVVVRTGRARANDFALVGVSVAAEPFYGQSALAESAAPIAVDPTGVLPAGNRLLSRAYDRRPYALNGESASSFKRVYVVDLGAAEDRTTIVLDPRAHDGPVPSWARYRGGDVRAYDRSEEREVFGPSHPFRTPTDLAVTNGLLRVWIGPRGNMPYLHVAAWSAGAWKEMGTVLLGVPAAAGSTLLGARLVRCTPDVATVALIVDTLGDVFVTLRRGHRHLSISHGAGRPPLVTGARRVGWWGGPPGASTNVTTANGRFGKGWSLAAGGTIVFDWPRTVRAERWAVAGRWIPDAGSTAHATAGVAAILDSGAVQIGGLVFDSSTDRMVFSLGADVVSIPVAFTTGQAVGFVMSFSTETGMALAVNVADGAVTHATDATATDPNTTQATASVIVLLTAAPPVGTLGLYPAETLYPSDTLYPEG